MTLWWPAGKLTFFWANFFICYLTTSIPRSSDAFNYFTAYDVLSPNSYFTIHKTLDVFPTPGGPDNIIWGIEPWDTHDFNVFSWSKLPNT